MDHDQIASYYEDPRVVARLAEYCGRHPVETADFSCAYVVGYGQKLVELGNHRPFESFQNHQFPQILSAGLDVFRSVLDHHHSLFVFDVEYFNKSDPGLIYANPRHCFYKLEPLYHLTRHILFELGISHMTIMTGQGYHFVCQVHRDSPVFSKLSGLGSIPESLIRNYQGENAGGRVVDPDLAYGYEGMGRLQEFLCHLLFQNWRDPQVSLFFSDVIPENRGSGFEGISLDITAFADPIYMRDIRLPFSTHQKHYPVQVALPRNDTPLEELLEIRRDPWRTQEYAGHWDCSIPYAHDGIANLMSLYRDSSLYHIHQEWDQMEADPPEIWGRGYLAMNQQELPPCIRQCLQYPEPFLLQPTALFNLTRTLLFRGWEPKHIGGLVHAHYETNEHLRNGWQLYDAGSRAHFWIRIFSSYIRAGLDRFHDYDCSSFQHRGICPQPWCGTNLRDTLPG